MKTENVKCGEIFRSGPGQFTFSCSYCDEQFNHKTDAFNHIESHFFVEFTEFASNYVKEKDSNNCNSNAKLSNFVNLKNSSQNDDENVVEKKNDIITKMTRKDKEKQIRNPKLWGPTFDSAQCDICGSALKHRNMSRHMQSHANLKQFICKICNRRFNLPNHLKKHIDTHSTKKYSCDVCGWQFHHQANLVRHIRTHTGEKPYKCNTCGKSFAQSNTLIVHVRSHTGEKPFKCSICDQPFSAQSILQRHLRRHARDKKFKCNYCEMQFYSSCSLRDHQRSRHTGERPFQCEICKNSFSRRSTYRQHVILHTGVKPYKCRICDLTFAQGAGRRSHERSVHKDVAHLIAETKIVLTSEEIARAKEKTKSI